MTTWSRVPGNPAPGSGPPSPPAPPPVAGGGRLIPDAIAEEMLVQVAERVSAWIPVSEEMIDWWRAMNGLPPLAKGLAWWQRREADLVRAPSLRGRLRARRNRLRWLVVDVPRRLANARAALAGEWAADPDRD